MASWPGVASERQKQCQWIIGRDKKSSRFAGWHRVLRVGYEIYRFIFFFSSRRRHTRFDCDWSSDVCSSDLDEDPTHWSPVLKAWVLTRYEDVKRVCLDSRLSSDRLRPFFATLSSGEAEHIKIGRASCRERV